MTISRPSRPTIAMLAVVLLSCPLYGAAVECFVCSYAPRSNSSRIDGCTENNFTDIVIDTRTCDFGCEKVASYDSNGELESYHRNCAHLDTVLTNGCETHETVILTKIVCACDFHYCNNSPSWSSPHHAVQFSSLVAVLSYVWLSTTTVGPLGRRPTVLLLSSPP